MSDNVVTTEQFIINDIEMGIAPSDIQLFDDNYIFEQSFLRSNSVYCYRSKYSDTKMVLNFPFQIGPYVDGSEESNHTANCLKLITELNSYPFCFIKSNRIKTYISPMVTSSTGFLMFAVEELALVQSATASNLVFLEVTLRYFNHAPLTSDFEFVANNTVYTSGIKSVSEKEYLVYEREMLQKVSPVKVSSLSSSPIWSAYMDPKITRVYERLAETKVLSSTAKNDDTIHPGLDVQIHLPMILTNAERAKLLVQEDDGSFIGPDSKSVLVTDIDNIDDMSLPTMINNMFSQDFRDEEEKAKEERKKKKEEETVPVSEWVSNSYFSPEEIKDTIKQGKLADNSKNEKETYEPNSIKAGSKEIFINYSNVSLSQLGFAIQKIEVRKRNLLVSQKIGSYKHPIIQYMGKVPAKVVVHFSNPNDGVYTSDDVGVGAFLTNAFQIIDENRMFHPEADVYNHAKIHSLATVLLGAESVLPNQNMLSASADQAGVENIIYSFTETNSEEFIKQFQVEASGARSMTKAYDDVFKIVISWLNNFKSSLTSGKISAISKDPSQITNAMRIFQTALTAVVQAVGELGYSGNTDDVAIQQALQFISEGYLDIDKENKSIDSLYFMKGSSENSGLNLYLNLESYAIKLTDEEAKQEIEAENSLVNYIVNTLADAMLPGITESTKKVAKAAKAKETGAYVKKPLLPGAYAFWLSSYAVAILQARNTAKEGKATSLKNVEFKPKNLFDTCLMNTAALINASVDSDPVSAKLSAGQKDFLKNLSDMYIGSLYGQNLEDLHLEDLSPNYDRSKDVLIQSTDPFFFLYSPETLGTEMIEFYNNSYGEERLNPTLNALEDGQEEPAVTGADALLNVEYRKISEVDFNADTFAYYNTDSDVINPTDYTNISLANTDARNAIENALKKYGYSGDEAFRRYMYKTASIESNMGTNLKSGTGAKGLFQFTEVAVQQVMMINNKVFTQQGWVGLSKEAAKRPAKELKARPNFSKDFQLSADMFIELFQYNGGKKVNPKTKAFDEAYTFAYHNIGAGGGEEIGLYLSQNKLNPSSNKVRAAMTGNGAAYSNTNASWYNLFNHKFSTARLQLGGKLDGDGEVEKKQTTNTKASTKATPAKDIPLKAAGNQAVLNPASNTTGKNLVNNAMKTLQANASKNASKNQTVVQKQKAAVTQQTAAAKANTSVASTPKSIEQVGTKISGTIKNVVDGDTVDVAYVANGKTAVKRVRLQGLDTEETSLNRKYNEQTRDWGEAAKAKLGELLKPGSKVTVSITNNDQSGLDEDDTTSGRLEGVIKTDKGVDPALELLKAGLAKPFEGLSVSREYNEAVKDAQTNNRGQWSKQTVEAYNKAKDEKAKSGNTYKAASATVTQAEIDAAASNPNAPRYNFYQPFQGGQRFKVSSEFTYGKPRKDIERSTPHNGIDISCPVGTVVVAAAAGTATHAFQAGAAGLYVRIDHGNGFVTTYMHLSSVSIGKNQKVAAGQPIGLSGGLKGNKNSGSSTGPHLHYEVRFKNRPIHPYSTKKPLSEYTSGEIFEGEGGLGVAQSSTGPYMSLSYDPRQNINEENTVYNENALAQAILEGAREDVNQGLRVAVPAIKAYIMIGNENDGLGLDTMTTGSQYYELKGIQSFKLFCNNDNTPVDVAVMTILDPSFANTDAWTSLMKAPEVNFDSIGSDFETQFKFNRALIRPGTKLSIRLGYGNDPNYLTTVFNGGVTEVNQGESNTLTLLLEGYGRELLAEIKNPAAPEKLDGANHAPTTTVLGLGLHSKPIDHFGYMNTHLKWLYKGENDPEARSLVKPIDTGHSWFFTTSSAIHRSRLYMNIFAPEIEKVDDSFAKYWSGFFGSIGMSNHQFGYPFYVYQMSPWDICKQMEYRHPGTIFKPMMFEDRMTPFYGIKEQMYIAKDLSRFTQIEVATRLKSGMKDATTEDYFKRRRERMLPVSNMHFVTSSTNLISNQIKLNAQWKTCTNVSYFEDNDDFNEYWNWKSTKMEVDDNLLPWEIREKELKMTGIHGKYTSFVYGTTDLKKEAETMYDGKILITGNAKVKCGDFIFIDDLENRLSGLALVRECIHHFDPVHGFVTEITPGLYTEPAQFMYTSLWLQLMCAMKVGSSKTRLVLSSTFASEYDFVKEYLRVIKQLKIADNQSVYDTPVAVIGAYSAAVGLGAWLGYSLAKNLGVKNPLPGANAGKFAYTTVASLFKDAEYKLALKRAAKIKRSEWYVKGAAKAAGWKNSASSKVLGSEAYKKLVKTRAARTAKVLIKRNPLFRVPLWAVKRSTAVAVKSSIRAGLALMHGVASTNPLGLVLDIALTLAVSWVFAKVEKSQYTRQPLLFFPLIKHGKPYQAGMTGAIRNSYWDSITSEWDKTTSTLSKAAAILEGSNSANNKGSSFITKLLAQPAKRKQADNDSSQYIMTKSGENYKYYERKSEVEKQTEKALTDKKQTEKLKEATK